MKEKTINETLTGRGKTFAMSLKALFKVLGTSTVSTKKAVANTILDCLQVYLERAGVTGVLRLDTDNSKANYVALSGDLLTIHLTSLPNGKSVLQIVAKFGTEARSVYNINLWVNEGATGTDQTESLEFNVSELLSLEGGGGGDLAERVATLEDEMDTVNEALEYAGDSWLTYGVVHRVTEGSPDLVRVGNMDMHRSLPVQSLMRRCVLKDDGSVRYYLDDHNSELQADGETASVLDGTDGQVMVEIPHHYRKHTYNAETNSFRTDISLLPFTGALEIPQRYISAYGATVLFPESKLCSVQNTTANYRGGDGTHSDWDETDKSLLGKRSSLKSLTQYRTMARNRGANWGCADYSIYMDVVWLLVVEYATLNSQKNYNSVLDTNGCRQGCLGAGVSNIDASAWGNWNGYHPFIPCGYTNSLGNLTGVKSYTMPYGYDTKKIGAAYTYEGVWSVETTYTNTNTVSVANGDLYKCIAAGGSTGEDPTTTAASWTKVTRTTTSVNSYRGIENLFGEIWNITDGYLQLWDSANSQMNTYICRDHTKYASSVTEDYTLVGHNASSNGYVKTSEITEYGDFLPKTVGGSDSQYFCDYYYQAQGSDTYALFSGGNAYAGSDVGVFYFDCTLSVSSALARFGSRLCCFGAA